MKAKLYPIFSLAAVEMSSKGSGKETTLRLSPLSRATALGESAR